MTGDIYISGENCLVSGAYIKHTSANNFSARDGGAIFAAAQLARIENCSFEGCTAQERGGAIFIYGDYAKIINCVFTRCSAAGDGGAIFVDDYFEQSLVENCSFSDCSCASDGSGQLVRGWNTLVVNCVPDTTDESLFYGCEFADSSDWLFGSILSCGSIWIVIAILVITAIAVICITRNRRKASAE